MQNQTKAFLIWQLLLGSKTTELSAIMNNTGKIVANEIDKIRFDRLNYNIKMQGASNIETINKDGTILWKIFPEQFDKVLLDTPCSGEGRFEINDRKSYQNWSTNLVKNLVKTQKELMESAIKCCKKGGTIVYSTCTLNRFENEEIIDYALKNFNLRIDKINIDLHNTIKLLTMFINDQDYKTVIGEQALKVVSQVSSENRRIAEQQAIEEIAGYLRPIYDTVEIFQMQGEDRNKLIVMYTCDIAIYHMAASTPQKMGMDIRKERYERAVKWLEQVQAGKVMPDLPRTQQHDGTQQTYFKYGSQKPLKHNW